MSNQIVLVIMALLTMHWFSDFLIQTDWQATNKSKSWKALLDHTIICAIVMTWFIIIGSAIGLFVPKFSYSSLLFGIIMFVSHTIIDYMTSRITSKLWEMKKIRPFFDVIGFDQLLHYATIFLTYNFLYK